MYEMETLPIKLLVAAEREFALHGLKARVADIVRAAGSGNAAAVNYHFRSRNGLFAASRLFREEPLNRFRGKLLAGLESAAGGELSLQHCLFALVAPSLAVMSGLLPESFYGRFVAKINDDAPVGMREREGEKWAEPEFRVVAKMRELLGEILDEATLDLRLCLYQQHVPGSLAQLELYMMRQITKGVALADVKALVPGYASELARQLMYVMLQDQYIDTGDWAVCERVYSEALEAFGPFVYRVPDRMRFS